ncbi:MAG: sporulation peptidase YabG [Bacilli bacterium]|jgi:yabG peptidase U57|nr:sporulation peptidase YabG [Bacilli bacterium]
MFKVGDLVTRISHDNDVVFKIDRIIDGVAYLKGVNVRLCADSDVNDLVLVDTKENDEDKEFYERLEAIRNFERSDYFYIPGKILHVDGDREYLNRCLEFYKKANVLAFGVYSPEEQMATNIEKYLEDINPDIVVITGHDSSIKQNSKYFSDAVKVCRKYQKDYDKLIIVAGACQSEYEKLIKSGANFASSPKKINIHALDPAIIALSLSLLDKNKNVDLIELLSKTSNGKDGMGGVNTKGVMTIGYPR